MFNFFSPHKEFLYIFFFLRIGSFSLMIVNMFGYPNVPLAEFFFWNSSLPIRRLSSGCRYKSWHCKRISFLNIFIGLQEPKTDKDETYCRKVNEYLNNPPAPGSQSGRGGSNLGNIFRLQVHKFFLLIFFELWTFRQWTRPAKFAKFNVSTTTHAVVWKCGWNVRSIFSASSIWRVLHFPLNVCFRG